MEVSLLMLAFIPSYDRLYSFWGVWLISGNWYQWYIQCVLLSVSPTSICFAQRQTFRKVIEGVTDVASCCDGRGSVERWTRRSQGSFCSVFSWLSTSCTWLGNTWAYDQKPSFNTNSELKYKTVALCNFSWEYMCLHLNSHTYAQAYHYSALTGQI